MTPPDSAAMMSPMPTTIDTDANAATIEALHRLGQWLELRRRAVDEGLPLYVPKLNRRRRAPRVVSWEELAAVVGPPQTNDEIAAAVGRMLLATITPVEGRYARPDAIFRELHQAAQLLDPAGAWPKDPTRAANERSARTARQVQRIRRLANMLGLRGDKPTDEQILGAIMSLLIRGKRAGRKKPSATVLIPALWKTLGCGASWRTYLRAVSG